MAKTRSKPHKAEILESREELAEKPKRRGSKKSPATEPLAEPAADSPLAQLLDARDAKATVEPETPMMRQPEQEPSGIDAPWEGEPSWAERARPNRPKFAPVPEGFLNVDRFETAGVRVNRSHDKRVVALQFAEDQVPSRPEKDAMESIDIMYKPEHRQWEREDRENPGTNIIDAKRLGQEIARERQRFLEVMGR